MGRKLGTQLLALCWHGACPEFGDSDFLVLTVDTMNPVNHTNYEDPVHGQARSESPFGIFGVKLRNPNAPPNLHSLHPTVQNLDHRTTKTTTGRLELTAAL